MSSTTTVNSRLSVITAREAPLALIFRRGPSKWTHLILWNMDNDTFESGAWFKGQIYSERCDISPDGSKLIYFAANYLNRDDFSPTWTAVSKTPWLTALALWPQYSTYFGGGLFETNNKVWANPDCSCLPGYSYEACHVYDPNYIFTQQVERPGHFKPDGLEVSYDHRFYNHDRHFFFRLEREGWLPVEPYPEGSTPLYRYTTNGYAIVPSDPNCSLLPFLKAVHEKPKPQSSFSLFMTSKFYYSGGEPGEDSRTFEVRNKNKATLPWKNPVPLDGAVWADWDNRGRLLYAKEGKLYAAEVRDGMEISPFEIADFNGIRPKRTRSPKWAREW